MKNKLKIFWDIEQIKNFDSLNRYTERSLHLESLKLPVYPDIDINGVLDIKKSRILLKKVFALQGGDFDNSHVIMMVTDDKLNILFHTDNRKNWQMDDYIINEILRACI